MKQNQKRPTIKRLAELAGVSRGTVDRALNNRGDVAAEVAERIQRIAQDVGYVPNRAAKALRFNYSPQTIGVLIPKTSSGFFAAVADGVANAEQALAGMGIHTGIRHFNPLRSESFEQQLSALVDSGVAGIVLTGPDTEASHAAVSRAIASVPVVTLNSDINVPGRLCFVGQDLHKSGRVAGELMSKILTTPGRVIAVTGNLKFQAHRDRVLGFQESLREWSPESQVQVLEAFDSYDGTSGALSRALAGGNALAGLYMATGSVPAAIQILRANALAGSTRMITNDLLPAVREGLKERIIDYTILQDPFHQGEMPVRILAEYLLSGTPPQEPWYRSPITITGAETL